MSNSIAIWTSILVFLLAQSTRCYQISQQPVAERLVELETKLQECRDNKTREIIEIMSSCHKRIHSRRRIVCNQSAISNTTRVTRLNERIGALETQLQANITHYKNVVSELNRKITELNAQINADARRIEELETLAPKSCRHFGNTGNNVHDIYVPGLGVTSVSCNDQLAGSAGWTVIQRRFNGNVDFYRSWNNYKKGFGDIDGEFFIGLETLHLLTISEGYELYIQLQDFENETRYAHYNHFIVGSEREFYELKSLGNYSGNAGDVLKYNLKQKFSTFDSDNDYDEDNCAEDYHGAWWYRACTVSNLNGLYIKENKLNNPENGIIWANEDWHQWEYSFKSVAMMIRPKLNVL